MMLVLIFVALVALSVVLQRKGTPIPMVEAIICWAIATGRLLSFIPR